MSDPYSRWVWQHVKSGGEYTLLGDASVQTDTPLTDMSKVYVYRGQDGRLWVRPLDEFDSRFKRIRPLAGHQSAWEEVERALAAPPSGQQAEPTVGLIQALDSIEAAARTVRSGALVDEEMGLIRSALASQTERPAPAGDK